jgi:N-methylhydantoinase A
VRVRSIGYVARPAFPRAGDGRMPEPSAWRATYFRAGGERVRTPVYDRDALSQSFAVEGPAIVEEWTTTTLVPPGWSAGIDRIGNLVLTAKAEGEE